MRIGFVTLFPQMVRDALGHSIMARAVQNGLLTIDTADPREFATDKHRTVDDSSYGGGPGMVMKPDVVQAALESLKPTESTLVALTDPAGEQFTQQTARELSACTDIVLVCGHYEGIDERVRTRLCHRAFSIGDYVLTGGELPALVIAEAVARLVPGVIGRAESHEDDSHAQDGLLGFPLYTKPREFEGEEVPDVLLSGDHQAIARWRRQQQLLRTKMWRPDLFDRADLRPGDLDLLQSDS